MARAVLTGVPHHLTQRGLDREPVFFSDTDREVYLGLVRSAGARFGVDLLGYCLMTNHVHWVVVPRMADSLARAFGEAHGRYAAYANARISRSGHFWQNRFFSCCLDGTHLWAALRYVEKKPDAGSPRGFGQCVPLVQRGCPLGEDCAAGVARGGAGTLGVLPPRNGRFTWNQSLWQKRRSN